MGQQSEEVCRTEIPLFDDEDTQKAFEVLISKNITPEEYKVAIESHKPILVPRARQRQVSRTELDELVKNEVGRLLASISSILVKRILLYLNRNLTKKSLTCCK